METIVTGDQLRIEVCYSPALFPVYYQSKNCVVVVIDVFRATSAICTAFQNGVKEIIPVATIEEAKEYKEKGYLVAAERNGEVVDGFDMGNSPFSYMGDEIRGKKVVLTTTNGTKAVERAKAADQLIIGSFLNLKAVCNFLEVSQKNVILLCAGWRDRFNLEDSLFAGAVIYSLSQNPRYTGLSDSSLAAKHLYGLAKDDLNAFLASSSHRNRLKRLNLDRDINYCLQENTMDLVPIFEGNALVIHGA